MLADLLNPTGVTGVPDVAAAAVFIPSVVPLRSSSYIIREDLTSGNTNR